MNVTIPCPCPPKADGAARHDEDTVTLRAVIDFPTAVLLQKSVQAKLIEAGTKGQLSASTADILALMTQVYVRNCIEAWTLVDEKGKAIEVTPQAIVEHLESNIDSAMSVADAADEAYAEVVLPLVMRVLNSLRPTPIVEPTSAKPSGSSKHPKPSKPSSTASIPTVVTGPIIKSRDGDSSTLPSSASAA